MTTKTLRRRFFSLAGRLTRSAPRLTLQLPQHWPWENQFSRALARLTRHPAHGTSPQLAPSSVREHLLLRTPLAIPPGAITAGRGHPLCAAAAPCTQPNLLDQALPALFPLPLIPSPTSMATSLRWIRAKGASAGRPDRAVLRRCRRQDYPKPHRHHARPSTQSRGRHLERAQTESGRYSSTASESRSFPTHFVLLSKDARPLPVLTLFKADGNLFGTL